MKKLRPWPLLAFLVAALQPGVLEAKLRILTSVFPLREFAAAVAGDRGEAKMLLPPGAGVHTWQPRPSDVRRLDECDVFIFIGADLEPWLPGLLKALPGSGMRTLEASRGLALLEAGGQSEDPGHDPQGHGASDPHLWLDFELDTRIVRAIAETLADVDPAGGDAYRRNAESYNQRLADLDAEFRRDLADCRDRRIVVAGHAAFGYLARRYGLRQTAVLGLSPDSQPGPRALAGIVDVCRREGVRTVFSENSVPPDLARVLADEVDGRVLILYAGHTLTREQSRKEVDFMALMRENLRSLREGLGCR